MKSDTGVASSLKEVPLFEGLSDRELRDVIKHGRVVEHKDGSEVVHEGHKTAVGFHLILDGQANVVQAGEVQHQIRAGEYFGEIAVLDGKPRTATVRASGPLRTFSITAWDFAPLLDAHPTMARKLLIGLCAHVRALEGNTPGTGSQTT
jgi:CRP-like cAMP-binding protein